MKQETKEKKELDKVKELEKRLKDLTTHHNMVLDQISNLGLDLQMFCKKSKY
tara:strand:+ start:379 stop:534 length:156 start_codon:yes stop_codon:yes gene_type:complete